MTVSSLKTGVRLEGFSLPRQHSLETNQRLDKLAAARVDFLARGMLRGPLLPTIYEDDPWAGLGLDDDLYEDPRALAERHAVIDEDEDGGPVDNAEPLGCVVLAKRKGAYPVLLHRSFSAHTVSRLSSRDPFARTTTWRFHEYTTTPTPHTAISLRLLP